MEFLTWPINLWNDILNDIATIEEPVLQGEDAHAPVLYWPNLDDVISSALDDRQQKVIFMRYKEGMTYQAIGNELGLSMERIRQISKIARRKLRCPQQYLRLAAIPAIESEKLKGEILNLTTQNKKLIKQNMRLQKEVEKYRLKKQSQLDLDSPVEVLGITSRTRNCLTANGIEKVGQLIKCSEDTLYRFRHLGKVSLLDIKTALGRYGYELKP